MWMMRSVHLQNEPLLRSFGISPMMFYLVLVQGTESSESIVLCPDRILDHSFLTRVNVMERYMARKERTFLMFQTKIKEYSQKHKSILVVSAPQTTGGRRQQQSVIRSFRPNLRLLMLVCANRWRMQNDAPTS